MSIEKVHLSIFRVCLLMIVMDLVCVWLACLYLRVSHGFSETVDISYKYCCIDFE